MLTCECSGLGVTRAHGLVVFTRAREASGDAGQSLWGEEKGQAWAGEAAGGRVFSLVIRAELQGV